MFFPSVCFVLILSASAMPEDLTNQLRKTVNSFSRDFYHTLAQKQNETSIVSSPLSAQVALALLSLGSRGETQKELFKSLYLSDEKYMKTSMKHAMEDMNSLNREGVSLSIANKVYVKTGPKLNDEYKRNAMDIFKSEIESINFSDNVKAADTINKWIEEKTKNKIKKLLSPASINGETRLALVNAIHFKGNWEKEFDKDETLEETFHKNNRETTRVDMMHMTTRVNYADIRSLNAKALELRYKGGDMSMLFILPNEVEGLTNLEEKLADKDLNAYELIDNSLGWNKVEISLPKFKIETNMDLTGMLPEIGIERIFDDRSELTGLLKSEESLSVSAAFQKAFIEVNEEGAEAAAATVILVGTTSLHPVPIVWEFRADHPFIFAIRSKGTTLFMGNFKG